MGGTGAIPPVPGVGDDDRTAGRGISDRSFGLLLRIHDYGLRAMLGVTKQPDWKTKPHPTAYFDCIIGARVSRLAYDLYPDAPEPVRQFLRLHHLHELCHCTMERRPLPVHLADRISEFV